MTELAVTLRRAADLLDLLANEGSLGKTGPTHAPKDGRSTHQAGAKDFLSVTDVAERIQSSERYVYDELRRKRLRGIKIGAGWRITEKDLVTYVDAHANVSRVRGR